MVVGVSPPLKVCLPGSAGCKGDLIGSFVPLTFPPKPVSRSVSRSKLLNVLITAWSPAAYNSNSLSAPILEFRHPGRHAAAYRHLDSPFPILNGSSPFLPSPS